MVFRDSLGLLEHHLEHASFLGAPGVQIEIPREILVFKDNSSLRPHITWSTRHSWLLQLLKTEIRRGSLVYKDNLGLPEHYLMEYAPESKFGATLTMQVSLLTLLYISLFLTRRFEPTLPLLVEVFRLLFVYLFYWQLYT